jgi:hypothetical protein
MSDECDEHMMEYVFKDRNISRLFSDIATELSKWEGNNWLEMTQEERDEMFCKLGDLMNKVEKITEEMKMDLEYVIVRTYSAGVFAGYLSKRDGKEVELLKARRLWYWSGAASLSQLSQEGVKNPEECKFPQEVEKVILTEAIEILNVTERAKESIGNVKIWSA